MNLEYSPNFKNHIDLNILLIMLLYIDNTIKIKIFKYFSEMLKRIIYV